VFKKLLITALALSLLVPAAACAPKQAGTIKIGVVLSTTGLLGPMGTDMIKGADLAAKEINDAGGVLGKQIQLVKEDDTTDAAKALERVKKMVEVDGVQVMVGGMTSGAAMSLGPYVSGKSVLVVSPSATSPAIANQPWKDWVYRDVPDDAFQGAVLADFVKEKGYTKLAAIVQDNPYGVGLEKALVDSLKSKGWTGKQVVSIHFDPAKKDYRTELNQIKSANPDVVLAVTYAEDGIIIFRQASEMGLDNIAWLGCDGNYGDGLFADKTAADFMAKAIVAGSRAAGPSGAAYDKFAAAYKAYANKDASVYCDTVYDAIKLIAASMTKAGKTDGASVKAAMLTIAKNYSGASGTITLNDKGDRVSGDFELWKVVKDATAKTGYKNVAIKTVSAK
jgi:ABC-type branched-subunit amino acid transport system substrate-binding protein